MAQTPALFLPKKKTEEKPQVKKTNNKKRKKPENKVKVSALLQRRIDGYQKNNSKAVRMG